MMAKTFLYVYSFYRLSVSLTIEPFFQSWSRLIDSRHGNKVHPTGDQGEDMEADAGLPTLTKPGRCCKLKIYSNRSGIKQHYFQ